ncbi:unnamed protein product [Rotaria sordida]|uniref:Uncharacterized protein n=1 Tax=Rotaria sordida TaxID=392033 RepID=A0A813MUT7_9BILA|nr:unnamed protein product [Rotaria sordida]CAF0729706.1 unnamed protein product [Rotaria sordida]CAF0758174.1 unnamed protein product [Rotaria sordida]
MSYDMTTGTAKFERMTKEEKLRFCQDLIKQAANLTKSPDLSGVRSTGSKSSSSGVRSTSKSSKRPASISGTLSKKTKSGTLSHDEKSKLHSKSTIAKQSASKSMVKSSTPSKSKTNFRHSSSVRSGDNKSKANSNISSIRTGGGIQSSMKAAIPINRLVMIQQIDRSSTRPNYVKNSRPITTLSMRSNKSKSKPQHPSKAASHSSVKVDGTSAVRSASNTSGKKTSVKSSTSKAGSKTDLGDSSSIAVTPTSAHTKSGTISKSTAHSQSRPAGGTSSIRSTVASKSDKKTNGTQKAKSSTKKKTTTKSVRSPLKSSPMSTKTDSKISVKNKTKSSTKTTGKHRSKHSRIPIKDYTETCAVQFVPKFNANSTKNQVPIYHLIRHAFGNMVREAICQLDKEKSGVSSQQIIDHILKHYSFPNNISQSAIRNRTIFTINAGLRAGTLLTVSPNKGVRIGRMRRIYPRMLC